MVAEKPVLLSTMPKAGTYLLATILENLGLKNRGFHLAVEWAEDLIRFDERTCREFPKATRIPLQLNQALWCVRPGEFVFGHIPPHVIAPFFLKEFKVIFSFRPFRESLISEFYYFRDIRKDLSELGFDKNIKRHFIRYLKLFLPQRLQLLKDLEKWFEVEGVFFLNFRDFRQNYQYAMEKVKNLSDFLGVDLPKREILRVLNRALKSKTKTLYQGRRDENIWSIGANLIYSYYKRKYKVRFRKGGIEE